jgi:N-formylglutamate deformylase
MDVSGMSYSLFNPAPQIPLLASVPHSSSVIPEQVRDQFIVTDEELREQHRLLVDWFTDDLYQPIVAAGGCLMRYDISRFVVDPERFEDDSREIMSTRGMGSIYTHGCQLQRLRRELNLEEREKLLAMYYRPYHEELILRTKNCLERFSRCTIIDCHSYPANSLPYELSGNTERPDIVIGTDPIHTPVLIEKLVETIASDCGYSFGINKPFSGTYVPLPLYNDPRISAFMLEINRATYMDESSTKKSGGFDKMRSCIEAIVSAVAFSSDDNHGIRSP